MVADWHESGGVLLLGYEMYRLLTTKQMLVKPRRKRCTQQPDVINIDELDYNRELQKGSSLITHHVASTLLRSWSVILYTTLLIYLASTDGWNCYIMLYQIFFSLLTVVVCHGSVMVRALYSPSRGHVLLCNDPGKLFTHMCL